MHSWVPPFSNTHFLPQDHQKQQAIVNFAFAVKRIPPLQAPSNKDVKPHGLPGDVFCQQPPSTSPFPLHPHTETAPFLVGCTKSVGSLGTLRSPSIRIDTRSSEPPITIVVQKFLTNFQLRQACLKTLTIAVFTATFSLLSYRQKSETSKRFSDLPNITASE